MVFLKWRILTALTVHNNRVKPLAEFLFIAVLFYKNDSLVFYLQKAIIYKIDYLLILSFSHALTLVRAASKTLV